ncbi:FAD-binding oxidoreductase [Candidatus Woesebacteria bacterium]|nr:FAD-binding oxidoreductase [Candidatus Woesebacteria bacterium]
MTNTPAAATVAPRIQTFSARLSEKQIYNDIYTLYHFELSAPPRIAFTAGQYVLLTVPGTPYRRSYSIASEPDLEHAIELLVDLRPQGEATRYLGGLELGAEIEFMGPVGSFTVPRLDSVLGQEESELWFVATGSGIAPFRSMIEDLLVDDADTRPITLVWGLRHAEHQFWYDEFTQLAEQHANFTFRPCCLSRPQLATR